MKLKLKMKGKIMPEIDASEYYGVISTLHSDTTGIPVRWEHGPYFAVGTIGNDAYHDESELKDILKELDKIRIKQGVSFKKCKSFMNIE